MTEREFIIQRLVDAKKWLEEYSKQEDKAYLNGRIHELEWFLSLNWSVDEQDIDRLWPV